MSTFRSLYKAEKEIKKSLNAIWIFAVCLNRKRILGTKVPLNEIMVLTIRVIFGNVLTGGLSLGP